MLVIPFPSCVVILLCVVTVYISIGTCCHLSSPFRRKLGQGAPALVPVRGARRAPRGPRRALVAGAASSFRLSHPALTPLPVRVLPLHGTQRLVREAVRTAFPGGARGKERWPVFNEFGDLRTGMI